MAPSFWNRWRAGKARGRDRTTNHSTPDVQADSRARFFITLANWLAVVLVIFVVCPHILASGWHFFTTGKLLVDRLQLVIFAVCTMPIVLAWLCYSLIDHRVERQPIEIDIPENLAPKVRRRVGLTWAYEKQRASWSLSRAELFANMWGLTGTLTLLGGAFLSLPFLEGDAEASGGRALVALAISSAVGTRFLFDLGKICVRTGTDDASKRMFSEALRGLSYAVLTAGIAVSLAPVLGLGALLADHPERAAGVGAGFAFLGGSSVAHLQQRLAVAFGVSRVEIANLTPINAIAGCSPAEIDRLRDEGIESVEALINTPVPRLFLATRFSLQRICDWMDRGQLLCLLGAAGVSDLRSKTGIVGARSLRELCTRDPERAASVLVQAARLGSRLEASILVQRLIHDDDIALLDGLSQALPRLNDRASPLAIDSHRTPNTTRVHDDTTPGSAPPEHRPSPNGHHREPFRGALS